MPGSRSTWGSSPWRWPPTVDLLAYRRFAGEKDGHAFEVYAEVRAGTPRKDTPARSVTVDYSSPASSSLARARRSASLVRALSSQISCLTAWLPRFVLAARVSKLSASSTARSRRSVVSSRRSSRRRSPADGGQVGILPITILTRGQIHLIDVGFRTPIDHPSRVVKRRRGPIGATRLPKIGGPTVLSGGSGIK